MKETIIIVLLLLLTRYFSRQVVFVSYHNKLRRQNDYIAQCAKRETRLRELRELMKKGIEIGGRHPPADNHFFLCSDVDFEFKIAGTWQVQVDDPAIQEVLDSCHSMAVANAVAFHREYKQDANVFTPEKLHRTSTDSDGMEIVEPFSPPSKAVVIEL